jgi:phosphate transport system permease protein
MQLATRKLLDRAFSGLGLFSVALMALSLVVIIAPIVSGGLKAFIFSGTVEHRRVMLEMFGRGDREAVEKEVAAALKSRQPILDMLAAYRKEQDIAPFQELLLKQKSAQRGAGRLKENENKLIELENGLRELLGPFPGDPDPVLPRNQYGQTRWDRAKVKLQDVLFELTYDYSDPSKMGKKVLVPRANAFRGTALEPLFPYLEKHAEEMLLPRLAFYWRFLTDNPKDSNFFGGIWPMLLGTIYLAVGAMLFAVPFGVIAAIYLTEYARQSRLNSFLRTCIGTLAGVPSIVFGLFGLAFFINTLHVSKSRSVLAGSLTLALLVLPTIIRASEEAIRAVPHTYKEAALSLGASKWHAIATVILPAALPGILTGIIISMGRAAGETAPIIFTAAVSIGDPLSLWQTTSNPTPALSWNVYNLCTEHQKLDELRHVQYGMVLALVSVVLLLNMAALILRARISRKLRG